MDRNHSRYWRRARLVARRKRALYFRSKRDGFRCIWAQRLDTGKHPIGPPLPIKHFHGSLSMMSMEGVEIGLNATRDRLFFSLVESSGNIWLARINQP